VCCICCCCIWIWNSRCRTAPLHRPLSDEPFCQFILHFLLVLHHVTHAHTHNRSVGGVGGHERIPPHSGTLSCGLPVLVELRKCHATGQKLGCFRHAIPLFRGEKSAPAACGGSRNPPLPRVAASLARERDLFPPEDALTVQLFVLRIPPAGRSLYERGSESTRPWKTEYESQKKKTVPTHFCLASRFHINSPEIVLGPGSSRLLLGCAAACAVENQWRPMSSKPSVESSGCNCKVRKSDHDQQATHSSTQTCSEAAVELPTCLFCVDSRASSILVVLVDSLGCSESENKGRQEALTKRSVQ
jgi:hypothetical protein